MNKRWRWGLGLVAMLGVGVCVLAIVPRGPTIDGRSLRSWVRDIIPVASADSKEINAPARQRALQAFENLADPVPVCVALLEMQPTAWDKIHEECLPKILPKVPFRVARFFPLPINQPFLGLARWVVLERLARLGPKASNAVPCLVRLLESTNDMTLANVVRALGQIGHSAAPAVPRLNRLLLQQADLANRATNMSSSRAEWAEQRVKDTISALSEIGGNDAVTIQTTARMLTNLNPAIRMTASETLWKIERQPQRLLHLLPQWLAEPGWDPMHRRDAAEMLARIAEVEQAALRPLAAFRGDTDAGVRRSASYAQWKLDGRTNIPVLLLADLAKDKDEGRRVAAMAGLAKYVGRDDLALSVMVAALKGDDSYLVRGWTAIYLGKLGPAASNAVPALTEALKDEYLNVRDAAAEALTRIATKMGPEAEK